MSKNFRCLVFLLSLCFLQTYASASVINLADIPSLVKSNSSQQKKNALELRVREIENKNTFFEYLPDLSAGYAGSLSDLITDPVQSYHSFYLKSQWPLMKSGNRVLDQKSRSIEFTRFKLEIEQDLQKEILETAILLLNTQKQKLLSRYSLSNESTAKMEFNYTVSKQEQGKASAYDVVNAQSEYDNALYRSKSDYLSYEIALLKLRNKLNIPGLEISENIDFNEELFTPLTLLSNTYNETNTFDFKNINLNLKQAHLAKIRAIKNRFIPTFYINLNTDLFLKKYSSTTAQWDSDKTDADLDLGLALPLFENNTALNNWREKNLELKKLELDLSTVQQQARSTLKEKIENHNNKLQLLSLLGKKLESSQYSFQKVKEGRVLGITSLLELSLAEKNYLDDFVSLIILKFEILQLRAETGFLLGNTMTFLKP